MTQEALRRYVQFAERGRVVVFDTETTGISRDDEIIELAAVEYVAGEFTRSFKSYLIPSTPINPGAEAVHHLSLAFLRKNGVQPVEALDRFFAFLGEDVLLVAHNIRFDLRMLQNSCRKYDFSFEPRGLALCDTIAFAKRVVPGLEHYRLSYLIEALGLKGSNSHDALDDAAACGELFFNLVRRPAFRVG